MVTAEPPWCLGLTAYIIGDFPPFYYPLRAISGLATKADLKEDLARLETRQEVARAAMETRLTRQHYSGLAVLLAAITVAAAVG